MKIGIFGGSFNPPHDMHKRIATDLIKKNYLDKVVYVPTGDWYEKEELIAAKDRYNMVCLMIEDDADLVVSDYEIKNKISCTYQTLDYFNNLYSNDEIYFICGSDNLRNINTWDNYQYILDNYKVLVIRRDNDQIIDYKNVIATDILMSNLSSTQIREELRLNYCDCKICDRVLKYIKENNLYTSYD